MLDFIEVFVTCQPFLPSPLRSHETETLKFCHLLVGLVRHSVLILLVTLGPNPEPIITGVMYTTSYKCHESKVHLQQLTACTGVVLSQHLAPTHVHGTVSTPAAPATTKPNWGEGEAG